MGKYIYPAVFTENESGYYQVKFPDLEGCTTKGISLGNAMTRAEDRLSQTLYDLEFMGDPIPEPSSIRSLKMEGNSFASYIRCDTIGYQRKFNNKAVKKTVTIPAWMNELAVKAKLNFSKLLQDAIIEELHLK